MQNLPPRVKSDRELIVELLALLAKQRKCEQCVSMGDACCHQHENALEKWEREARRLAESLPS